MIYLITDTHLGHRAMINACGRPENFSSLICKNWAKNVKKSDTVIHLGDVSWTEDYLVKLLKLPGRKILVNGNHDKKSSAEYMAMGFELSVDELVMNFDGIRILFTHKPKLWHDADINIHGHYHDLHVEIPDCLYLPLSLEHMGYTPIAIDNNFMHSIHSWVDKGHQPKTEEIMELRQDYLLKAELRDYYGWNRDLTTYCRIQERYKNLKILLRNNDLWEKRTNPRIQTALEHYIESRSGKEDDEEHLLSAILKILDKGQ